MMIKLSPDERKNLEEYFSGVSGGFHVIGLNEYICCNVDLAIDIQEWAGDQLQNRGFNAEYELNPEGSILEGIIDKFYCALARD